MNDPDAVKEHLLDIIRNCEGLICYKCGLNRRRVKLYLAHVQNCDGTVSYIFTYYFVHELKLPEIYWYKLVWVQNILLAIQNKSKLKFITAVKKIYFFINNYYQIVSRYTAILQKF